MLRPGRVSNNGLHLAVVAGSLLAAQGAWADRGNPNCPNEEVFFDPGHGEDIVLPEGYQVDVFAKDLNFPTGLAFVGDEHSFKVLVVESGTGLPSRCNNNDTKALKKFDSANPFTPDLLIFDEHGNKIGGPFFKPTPSGGGYQPDGPAIGLAFERGTQGGTLFATDSNQGVRGAPGKGNNTSRVITLDIATNTVHRFIDGLPTGDHPTELIVVKDGFIYWSQGSATNNGVTGHDNGGGGNQHDIACQRIKLSDNVFESGDGHKTSGFSNHGAARPGAVVPPFEDATEHGMCTGAILRAKIGPPHPKVEPFSWGYRNPFGLRFAPKHHALKGGLFVTVNGEDERGARPTNFAPDRLEIAQMNPDGTPDFHGWPDRYGFLDSTQAVFSPVGGPGDDLTTPAVLVKDRPVRPVLAFFPQPPIAALALEPADVAVVGPDFAPNSFTGKVVKKGAALVAREGDFGFSAANGEPEEGHDIQLVNFSKPDARFTMSLERFAMNCRKKDQFHTPGGHAACKNPADHAFVEKIHAINRPIQVLFGPDRALYLVDYGAVRDFGQSNPDSRFCQSHKPSCEGDGPLLQIPHTGVIWKITKVGGGDDDDADDRDEREDD